MKQTLLYILLFCSAMQPALAQTAQGGRSRHAELYFRNGEKEFSNQRYMYAIPFYLVSLKHKSPNDSLASLHIAESYWYVRNYDSALIYFKEYERKYGPLFSTRQHIAEIYATLHRFEEAADIYKKLIAEVPPRTPNLLQERYKGFSNTKPFYTDSLDFSVRLLNLNTPQQDFSPQYYQAGMVFVSNRYTKTTSDREFGWDGLPFANIYWVKDTASLYTTDTVAGKASRRHNLEKLRANDDYTSQTSNDNDIIVRSGFHADYNGTVQRLPKFSTDLNTKYNYGPLCFNKAGNRVYFTRNNLSANNGRYNLEICVASFEKGSWGNVHVLPFVEKEYDFFHPALSEDESRLYFCSNRPGGQGGSDIYYVDLGPDIDMKNIFPADNKINTAGNELFPTIHGDTLFFSSDGHPGLGGLDIYSTYRVKGVWQTPRNLGYPVNSSYDDFGIVYNANNKKGFFSSNRLGTDDIYVFEHNPFEVAIEGTVLNKLTLRRLDSALVIMIDKETGELADHITDITGNYFFHVKPNRAYTVRATHDGFVDDSLAVTTATQRTLALDPLKLAPIPKPVVVTDRDGDGVPDAKDQCPDVKGPKENNGCPDIQAEIDKLAKMVFFKTASDELSPVAIKPLNEVAAYLTKYPNLTLYIEGHTDNRASAPYNLDLSQRRARSVKNFFIKKGFNASRFTTAGFGLERPIADNNTEEGRAMNRRVAIKANFH